MKEEILNHSLMGFLKDCFSSFQSALSHEHLSGQLAQVPQDEWQEKALPQAAKIGAGTPCCQD